MKKSKMSIFRVVFELSRQETHIQLPGDASELYRGSRSRRLHQTNKIRSRLKIYVKNQRNSEKFLYTVCDQLKYSSSHSADNIFTLLKTFFCCLLSLTCSFNLFSFSGMEVHLTSSALELSLVFGSLLESRVERKWWWWWYFSHFFFAFCFRAANEEWVRWGNKKEYEKWVC